MVSLLLSRHWIQESAEHDAALQDFGCTAFGELCADLVAPFQEGCGGFGEGAQVVYQNAAWIECTSYNKRLDISRLFSLEHQRSRGGLLDVSGIIRDKDRVDSQNLFLSFLPTPPLKIEVHV